MATPKASVTAAQVRAAREWIADCEWGDLTRSDIRRLSVAAVVRGVERHYSGGWAAFVADAV